MEEGRIGENLMHHRENPPPPPRRRPENQLAAAQPPPAQKCPRCESSNTKFCYYNNYSLSQPRYFCKACRRYWTHGGTLRNVPVGGGCRKTKRTSPKPDIARSQPFSAAAPAPHQSRAPVMPHVGLGNSCYSGGAFLSSLAGMQSLTTGGGGVNNNVGANMALLQNLQSLKQNDQLFQSLNLNPVRPGPGSWTQSFISTGPSSSNFWSRDCVGNQNQAGSNSFFPNQWPDINNNNNSAGFDPSR